MKTRRLLPLLLAALLFAGGPAPARGREDVRTVMLPMADGVRLATDVHVPDGEGPWPVILYRTPYGRGRGGAAGWVRRGYAVVIQDMRGRFDSGGENIPFIGCGWGEHRDGFETVAWIRKQPWCDGKVGTAGGSALGITQSYLAGAAPEGLACQYIQVASASLYHDAVYVGGALRKSQVERWLAQNRFDPVAIRLYRAHPAYDEFWHVYDSTRRAEVMRAPATHVGGWFDTFADGTVKSYRVRAAAGGGRQRLVMGPWGHGGRPTGELRFPDATMPDAFSAARWFDHWLKGAKNGVEDGPAVAFYVMGDVEDADAPGNEWRFADRWPIPAKPTPFYLGQDGGLTREAPAAKDACVEYVFDPKDPCPTVGGANLVLPAGPRDQRGVEERKDVVTFTTGPLAEPIEVTGHAEAVLFVSTSAVDTDLSVRFSDVYPDGRSFLMAEGMLRLRYRDGFETSKPAKPGAVSEVRVPLWPTSVVVNRGHRIRIAITSSNYPRFDVNPGTGRPWRDGGKTLVQRNRIFRDAERPSRVVLPVVAR